MEDVENIQDHGVMVDELDGEFDENEDKFIKSIQNVIKVMSTGEGKELAGLLGAKFKNLFEKFQTLDDDEKSEIRDRIKSQLSDKISEVENEIVTQVRSSVLQKYAVFFGCVLVVVVLLAFFANKLYKSLTYKERMKEEKRKAKEERKKDKKKVK